MKHVALAPVVLSACALSALAAEAQQPAVKLQGNFDVLAFRAGTWDHEVRITMPGERKTVNGRTRETARLILGGKFLETSAKSRQGNYENRAIYAYDEPSKTFRLYFFDSNGGNGTWTGRWDAQTRTVQWSGKLSSGASGKGTWTIRDRNSIHWTSTITDRSGKVLQTYQGKLTRAR